MSRAPGSVIILFALAGACGDDDHERDCTSAATCTQAGVAGECLPSPASDSSWCAYPDPSCPDTGQRWGVLAGDGLAETCVAGATVDGGSDATNIDAAPPVDGSGTACSMSSECPAGEYCHFDMCTPCSDLSALGFNAAVNVSEVNTSGNDQNITLSGDGTRLYVLRGSDFIEYTLGGDGTWGSETALAIPATSGAIGRSRITTADMTTYYFSQRADVGGIGLDLSIWKTTRSGVTFSPPIEVSALNRADAESGFPSISADGVTMVIQSNRESTDGVADPDIWTSTYNAAGGDWSAPVKVPMVNSGNNETSPSIRGEALLFTYGGTSLKNSIFVSTPPGSTPYAIPDVNSPAFDTQTPVFTPDMCTLYFVSNRPNGMGAYDVWRATRR